jgi:hypothetical protein
MHADEVEGVDDAVLAAAATPRLQVLHVRRCRGVTDEAIGALAQVATGALQDLALSETLITSAALDMVALHCVGLHSLHVRQCWRVKSEAPLVAIAHNGALCELDASFLDVVTHALLLELAASCARPLRRLALNFCRNIPASALGATLDACTDLTRLEVFGCSQLTRAALLGHCNDSVVVHGEPTLDAATGAAAEILPPAVAAGAS